MLRQILCEPRLDAVCRDLGIPVRLRRNNRNIYNIFDDGGEFLYRRCPPDIVFNQDGTLTAASAGPTFKPPRDISCNRERFCDYPTDVLYNIKELPHYNDCGVIEAPIGLVNNHTFIYILQQKKGVKIEHTITFVLVHSPEVCMYPHSEIYVMKDGVRLKDVRQETLKTEIRRELSKIFTLKHEPSPNFKLS